MARPFYWQGFFILIAFVLLGFASPLPGRATDSDDNITRWIADLQSPDSTVRHEALTGIGNAVYTMKNCDVFIEPLAKVLPLEHFSVPQMLRTIILVHPDTQMTPAVAPLIESLSDSEASVRAMSAEALGCIMNKAAVQPLIDHLSDPSVNTLGSIIFALGYMEDPSAANALVPFLAHADAEIRMRTAVALGKMGDRRAIPMLLQMLKSPNIIAYFREMAAELLGKLGDLRSVQPLLARLHIATGNEKTLIITSLGKLRDRRAITPLTAELNGTACFTAIIALKQIGTHGAVPALIHLLKACGTTDEKANTRAAAAEALQSLTGQTFGEHTEKWDAWWQRQKK